MAVKTIEDFMKDIRTFLDICGSYKEELLEVYDPSSITRLIERCSAVTDVQNFYIVLEDFVEMYEGMDEGVVISRAFLDPYTARECVFSILKMYSEKYEDDSEVEHFVKELDSNRIMSGMSQFVLLRLLDLGYVVDEESSKNGYMLKEKGKKLLRMYELYFKYYNFVFDVKKNYPDKESSEIKSSSVFK